MSTARACRMCQRTIPSWSDTASPYCTPACRADWQALRATVYRRDRGLCDACGMDTVEERRTWTRWVDMNRRRLSEEELHIWQGWAVPRKRRTWWEVDHAVPIHLGGTNDLSNLVSLCLWCHRAKSKSETSERARKERAKPLLNKAISLGNLHIRRELESVGVE